MSDMPTADDAYCVCGHPHRAHEHMREGTDCGLCDCPRYRRRRWWRRS
jgi:hypothetical protein